MMRIETDPMDFSFIVARMLWPRLEEDADMRLRAMTAFMFDLLGKGIKRGEIEARTAVILFDAAAGAPPLSDVQKNIPAPMLRGMIAGHIVRMVMSKERMQIGGAIAELSKLFYSADRRLSVKTIQNQVWPHYRCVSHYWAAMC
jgi:hypothetical protein